MIYIDENTEKLVIPRLLSGDPILITIKDVLRNKLTNIELANIDTNKYAYSIDIINWNFKFINGSQYEYYLYTYNNDKLASGIIQCGEYNNNTVEYITEDKNYKQYNG